MDASTLFQIFVASFDQEPNVRISAELQLRKLEPLQGLIPCLLQLISPSQLTASHPSSLQVRLAAAIYLKNRVSTSWRIPSSSSSSSSATSSKYIPIPPSDRTALKTHLLPLLATLHADKPIKSQIRAIVTKVVDTDFPDDWTSLPQEIQTLIKGDQGQLEAGLIASVEVFRTFRYAIKDPECTLLTSLIHTLFPTFLSLANSILPTPTNSTTELYTQGNLLHLILKSYKNGIMHILVPELQESQNLIGWGTLFLGVIEKRLVVEDLGNDAEEREKHPWSKAKKWAVYSLNRLFTRFGNPLTLSENITTTYTTKSNKELYHSFAERFTSNFAPEIMKAYFSLVERKVGGEWVPMKVSSNVLSFFEDCIKPKAMWILLKPHVQLLIQHFAFPFLLLTEEEIEEFDQDPQEFSKSHFGDLIEDSFTNPSATALSFVGALVETRKSATLMPTLQFVQDISTKYPGQSSPREKDAALRLLIALAETAVKTKKLAPMMEAFFQSHVLPEFKSPHGFLRCRACEVIEKFESFDMTWENRENLQLMFSAVMGAITDPSLPVRIQGAISLPELVRYEEVREKMVPNIGRVMQELLKLSNEVELDALTNTTRSLVGEFSEEVIPFAVELTSSLTESYKRLVSESLEIREKEAQGGTTYESGVGDEKTFVSISILKTIEQLVRSLESHPESLDRVEVIVAPVLDFTVRNKLVELFDEVYEILDSITFFQKKISTSLWPLFEATYQAFKIDAIDYFNEMFGAIDNFVTFGAEYLSTNTEYRKMLVDIFDTVMTSRTLGAEDRVVGCKLGESLLLHLRGNIDEAIPPIVERCMTFVTTKSDADPDFTITNSLYLHSLELVITAVFYNPALSLAILDRHSWTQQFFASWFKHIGKLTRVHDCKLEIGAICAIFEWLASVGQTAPLAQNASQLVAGALQIFAKFPEALNARIELEKSFAEAGDDEDDDDEIEIFDDDEEDDEEDVKDSSDDYLQKLMQREMDREANEDDEEIESNWSDEVLWISPLDQMDVFKRFTDTLTSLETNAPALFQMATQPLTAEQRSQLEQVAGMAMQGGEQTIRQAAEASNNPVVAA